MKSLLQYRSLFSLRWLHEYYLPQEPSFYQDIPIDQQETITKKQEENYKVVHDFLIIPTSDCMKLLKGYHLIFKQNDFGFLVGCEVSNLGDSTFNPFISFNESFSLRFTVELQNQQIFNKSNLRLEKDHEKKDHFIYYFSNRANNYESKNSCYLSKPIPGFNSSIDYEAGEIIIDKSDPINSLMLEAIEDNGPSGFDGSQWFSIFTDKFPFPQFVTKEDRIVIRPKLFKLNVESAASDKLTFEIYNIEGSLVKTLQFKTIVAGQPLSECELILNDISSGYYSLKVKNNSGTVIHELAFKFYLDDTLFIKRPFALIECFHEPDGSLKEYSLLDADNYNRLLSPIYIINLKNRSSFWRYYFADAPNFTSAHVEVYHPTPETTNDKILVSKHPLGLTQYYQHIEIENEEETILLPNPDIASVFPEKGRVFSEINIGGGLGSPPAI